MSKCDEVKAKNKDLNKIISGYEKVLKLYEQELANADEIITMYDTILEYSRSELKGITDVAKAKDAVSDLSRDELARALKKIEELEEQNRILRDQRIKNKIE
jgi:hypothetical protein